MGPYRTPGQPEPPHDDARTDDRQIYVLLVLIGLIRVVIAVVDGAAFHAEATIAGLVLAAGAIGLLRGR